MWVNSTRPPFFTLAAYLDVGLFKSLCFLIVVCLYVVIICSNVLLIVVICVNRSLHEPMYVFLCSLFLNQLLGSVGLFPFLLVQILSDTHSISFAACFLQIFIVYVYGSVEFTSLAIMSYDIYLAICCPLHYNTLMSKNRVCLLIAMMWLPPFLAVSVTILLTVSLRFCGNVIPTVYCNNHQVIKLSCSHSTLNNVYELVVGSITVFIPLILIFYTYIRILRVCSSASTQMRQKAVSTCTPHLASIFNFSFGVCFEILQSRFNMTHVPTAVIIFLSLYFLTCQPLLNPLLYGVKLLKIRVQ
ncbi:olfactory receptor 142-like, partial [Thalassophryne amazonica]|uniref:olfactory receptor 142-like n=1 Tax=Thalassophryne amazonica TaxID=390379 RepID=UPI0014721D83